MRVSSPLRTFCALGGIGSRCHAADLGVLSLLVVCGALFCVSACPVARGSSELGARRIVLGRSVDGRAIVAFEIGDLDSRHRELVVGCIHGDEAAGVAVARALEHASPAGLDLWVVPVLNPDGVAAGTRGNAHGVDLNRNFPWRWRRLRGLFYSGAHPLSEPESRIAYRLIRWLHPGVSLWFHQHLDLVDESGGRSALERRYARLVGLRVVRLTREPGSVVGWENRRFPGTTAFVVELPAGRLQAGAVDRFADAALVVGGRESGGHG